MLALSPIRILAQAQEGAESGQGLEAMLLIIVFLVFISWLGGAIATKEDRAWLPRLVVWGFIAKMAGALARFWMVTVLYGSGDSYQYHFYGTIYADAWRNLTVPVSTAGGQGTAFTEVATSFVYAVYTPTFLGGFIIFALLAFIGQLFFYAAFRPWFGTEKQKLYAKAVLFFPSLVFWPASLGKDALMILGLGMAAFGISRLLRTYEISSLVFVVPGLYLAASIRPHVAGIFGLAVVLGLVFGKAPKKLQGHPKRALVILTSVAGAAVLLATLSASFGVTVEGAGSTQDPGEFLADVNEQTSTGGSAIQGGGGIASPAQMPLAIITVLFRPLIYEGRNAQVIVSALEGTALLALVIWKFPTMWRNKRLLRERPLIMAYFFYTGGFVVAFSAILNLGILARQRVQVLPMFLAVIVALGWDEVTKEKETGAPSSRRVPRRPPAPRHATASRTEPVTETPLAESPDGKAAPPPRPGQQQGLPPPATQPTSGRRSRQ